MGSNNGQSGIYELDQNDVPLNTGAHTHRHQDRKTRPGLLPVSRLSGNLVTKVKLAECQIWL